jgi:hypothetical protein
MKRKALLSILIICIGFDLSDTAFAQDVRQNAVDSSWSVGAGIGWSVYGDDYAISRSRQNIIRSPSGVMLVERRLGKRLSLVFDLSAVYENFDEDQADPNDSGLRTLNSIENLFQGDASLGARWVFNPGGVVELSGIVAAVGLVELQQGDTLDIIQNENDQTEYVYLDFETITYSMGLALGLALEKKLLDNLFLRFESRFIKGYYGLSTTTSELQDGSDDTHEFKVFNTELVFTPTIQLRLLI